MILIYKGPEVNKYIIQENQHIIKFKADPNLLLYQLKSYESYELLNYYYYINLKNLIAYIYTKNKIMSNLYK